ncbi:hypothetical protein [Streptomyces sp. NPDC056323]|uniref:hypothetical protein n=1 Tax=unclassified Streptomyces TaxID=2593676 RepID=UPI0035E0A907
MRVDHVGLGLPYPAVVTHRDEISAAGKGTPVTAELYTRGDVSWRGAHVRTKGRKVTDLRADTSGGAVSFVLPNNTGTVEWQEAQVRAFRQATSQGLWPGTPFSSRPGPSCFPIPRSTSPLNTLAKPGPAIPWTLQPATTLPLSDFRHTA